MNRDDENLPFNLAAQVVQFTGCNLFLTGKAGTGKTTFLKYIQEHTQKSTVVVAPTGVAAINAGGVTMHSFFQLPFIPFLPGDSRLFEQTRYSVDRSNLLKGIRFNKDKIDLIRSLELLIMDEVSMLRADMLDAMDEILRHFRQKRNLPFGGVQVLFIGDLYQLPPVVNNEEWERMKEFYESPFFFSARVMRDHPPLHIELKKIYRQKEEQFIELLNNIRNNTMQETDFTQLKARYRPDAMLDNANSIVLTSHNYMADKINQEELRKLPSALHQFEGEIQGDFSEKNLPTEKNLSLKEGAQIMFLRNDSDPAKRYFNGKLATVIHIEPETIRVRFTGTDNEMELEKEKWSNIRYVYNKETDHVEEEELGSFTQYPIRLAWAVTIHKSQGLTFDRVVIDAGSSFAAGQVYVALSRCRTLDGISLLTEIKPGSLRSDDRIVKFSEGEHRAEEIQKLIDEEKPLYASRMLLRTFDWTKLFNEMEHFESVTQSKKLPGKEMLTGVATGLVAQLNKQKDFADRFMGQLEQILRQTPLDETILQDRVVKAKIYFANSLHTEVLQPLQKMREFLKGKPQVKQYLKLIHELEEMVWKKLNDVQRVTFGAYTFEVPQIEKKVDKPEPEQKRGTKLTKGSSQAETLAMYKQGLKPEEIAKQRGYAVSTIENHLSVYVHTGEVNVFDFVSEDLLKKIQVAQAEAGGMQLGPIKQLLGDEANYQQIRFALNYLNREQVV